MLARFSRFCATAVCASQPTAALFRPTAALKHAVPMPARAASRRFSAAAAAAPTSPRPFRILGLQQVAIGGPSKAALASLWVDVFGCKQTNTFRSERENVDEDILTLGKGPYAIEIDLMEPINPDKSPRVDTPPLNHIGLWVDDIEAAVTWMTANRVRFTPGGIRKGAAGYNVVFIHPKGNEAFPQCGQGVLIELVQAPPEVIAALG